MLVKQYTLKITTFFILLSVMLLSGCSSRSAYQWSKVEIPTALQQNPEAVSYIEEMETLAADFNKRVHKVMELTGGNDINSNEELNTRKTIQLATLALKMSQTSSKMEELKAKRTDFEQTLEVEQQLAFAKVMNQIELQMGELDQKLVGISDEELMEYQKQKEVEQAEADSISTLHGETLTDIPESEEILYEESIKDDNHGNATPIETILFFTLFLGVVVFMAYRFIKRLKNKLQNMSHDFSTMKDTVKKLSDNPSSVLGENKELTNEEKESINKLNNLLNK
ncbi:MAG: hypothetical protein AB7S69_03280 [Salinivirgaceae bacterium]